MCYFCDKDDIICYVDGFDLFNLFLYIASITCISIEILNSFLQQQLLKKYIISSIRLRQKKILNIKCNQYLQEFDIRYIK